MGEQMKPISVKYSNDRLRKLARFEQRFGALIERRSDSFNLMIDLLDEMLPKWETLPRFNMAMTLLGAAYSLQDLLRPTLCVERDSSEVPQLTQGQVQIEFPAQQQECRPVELRHTPIQLHRFQLVNRPGTHLDRAWEAKAAEASASPRFPVRVFTLFRRLA